MKKLSLNKILDNRNLLISSIGVSSIGDTVFNITIMWFIYQETQSAISTSIIGVLWHLTSIFISPFAGTFVDRHTPNRVLLWSYFASGLICILLVLGYIILEYRDFVIYSSVFLLNSINTFIMPAKNRTLGKIVQKEKIPQVNGLIVSVNQISDIIGNSISGLLIGILGFAGSILFDSITFFIASLLISNLKIKRLHKDQNITGFVETNQYKGNYKKDLIDGIKFILRHRTMGKLVLLVLLINISSLVGPLYIILVNEQFKGGPTEYGILPPVIQQQEPIIKTPDPILPQCRAQKRFLSTWLRNLFSQFYSATSAHLYSYVAPNGLMKTPFTRGEINCALEA